MTRLYRTLFPVINRVDPETAHRAAVQALRYGLVPSCPVRVDERLSQTLWGIRFANPVGMAAGFDKNAEAVSGLLRQGFGFVEAGTVTPRPQVGNPRPRLFRLTEDRAVINRMGFNNDGIDRFEANLKRAQVYTAHAWRSEATTPRSAGGVGKHPPSGNEGVVGANIGKNKDTEDPAADYLALLPRVYPWCQYITVNISSPNTPGLRALQAEAPLKALLTPLMAERNRLATEHGAMRPLLVKIAPDLSPEELEVIIQVAKDTAVDGLIISNTTTSRPDTLRSAHKAETGGLSGAPLTALAQATLKRAYGLTGGAFPLIGVGGIGSPEDAYERIRAGASLIQLYSALVYEGFGLVRQIQEGLSAYLRRDGFATITEAVGTAA